MCRAKLECVAKGLPGGRAKRVNSKHAWRSKPFEGPGTVNGIARANEVAPSQVGAWKKELESRFGEIFAGKAKIARPPRPATRPAGCFSVAARHPCLMALIINDEEIPDEMVEGEFHEIKSHYERLLQVSCCERDPEFRGYAKENIIARVLLSQEAPKRTEEPSSDDVEAAREALFEEHGGKDKFYMNMGIHGGDEGLVLDNIRQSLRVERLLAETAAPLPDPDDAELEAFYQDHLDHFLTTEEIRASHITKNLSDAGSREEVYEQLRELRKKLKEGADFVALAEQENDDPEQQVDLGFFKQGEFMPEFETIAFSLDIGEISPVFSTHLGLHLCTVTDRKPPEPKPFEAVKEAALDLLCSLHREKKIEAFVERLKAEAKIEDTDPDEG